MNRLFGGGLVAQDEAASRWGACAQIMVRSIWVLRCSGWFVLFTGWVRSILTLSESLFFFVHLLTMSKRDREENGVSDGPSPPLNIACTTETVASALTSFVGPDAEARAKSVRELNAMSAEKDDLVNILQQLGASPDHHPAVQTAARLAANRVQRGETLDNLIGFLDQLSAMPNVGPPMP